MITLENSRNLLKRRVRLEGIIASYPLVPKDVGFFARFEVMNLIEEVAQKYPILRKADVLLNPNGHKGLILVDFRPIFYQLDLNEVNEIRKSIEETYTSWLKERKIRYINRFLIVDALVETNIDKIAEAVKKLKDKVKGRWRITLKTRKYPINREELISKAAEPISQPVDLENPEYIVQIEIIDNTTAIAIIKRE